MPRSYSVGEFADELGVHRQTVNGGVERTKSTTHERRVVLDGFLAGNCYVSPVMLDP
ncbi:MAG: hypothetical protein J07HQW2_02907 [Haloquadratum walsbyi J07HQW2]|uniref:Uncharacterized protein n=1 Tax=Haloquadratum walsbyi J07HQW2 TaxID=1238425 RepID=U1NHT2_9EURY|nr:MAG: hypothetical protein J07HQW2_02907 [Haloquadratum walsbyi J07HQW2]